MRGVTPILAGILLFVSLVQQSNGDCYMHNPRGSNNRLNERSANRDNANRLFDSQNNNRGGYNTGDKDDNAFSNENEIYYMKYFQSGLQGRTFLTVEWTNQHGCGGSDNNDPHKLNCNLVIQYTCQPEPESVSNDIANDEDATLDVLRDGENRNTQNYNAPNRLDENQAQYNTRRSNSVRNDRGLHEAFSYYDDCYVRERNPGLFLADQRLNSGQQGNLNYFGARFTRQNPNANRRGYECPEERDYYPYWHPTPWRDVAVLVDDTSRCSLYTMESFNVKPRYMCREKYEATDVYKPISRWNNEPECISNGGDWMEFYNYLEIDNMLTDQPSCEAANTAQIPRKWGRPYPDTTLRCLILLSQPDCQQVGWSRVNHLGNSRSGYPLNYTMELPSFQDKQERRCVLRIRYNISTDDYDPWTTNSSYNENRIERIRSPVTQNPYVDVGSITNGPLKLAINTAQFGRTFQDRSHVYILKPRPTTLINNMGISIDNVNIYNVNVRGKRGNIVQVYPAVEYDFIPNRLYITEDDLIHFQWTGSNTHNNQNPAGDGQAGDAGEGKGGTDRHNIVEIQSADMNYPVPFEASTLDKSTVLWYDTSRYSQIQLTEIPAISDSSLTAAKNLALLLSSTGYYQCFTGCGDESVESKDTLNNLLNNADASFYGPLIRYQSGCYHYICSRNNNFTNRSQKLVICVAPASQPA